MSGAPLIPRGPKEWLPTADEPGANVIVADGPPGPPHWAGDARDAPPDAPALLAACWDWGPHTALARVALERSDKVSVQRSRAHGETDMAGEASGVPHLQVYRLPP